ncbi:MAG: hypothetical protein R3C02_17695 [Planctomycetaceae bacterium]
MLTVSLGLIAAALVLAAAALSIAITLDRRDQDRRTRSRGGAVDSSTIEQQPTVVEWTHSLVLGNNGPDVSQPRPDIIIGPWTSSSVSVEERPRKAA